MQQTAKMSHRISIGPEPVLVAHVRSPPAAGSQRPVREDSGTSTRCTLSEGVYPHAQAEDMPTLRGSLANQHYPREVIQNFKGGNPHAPREAIPVIRGKSHRSEGGDPYAPRKAIRTIRGR